MKRGFIKESSSRGISVWDRGCFIVPGTSGGPQGQGNGMGIRAFTLIELLVVVLIIGILTAIALPQYEKTVWKSKNAELKQLVRSIAQAEQVYYLANGKYAADFSELDLDVPLTPVVTTAGGTTGACSTITQGTDSSRTGKDFYIVLNSTVSNLSWVNVVAYYNTGKYKCAGFAFSLGHPTLLQELHCREKRDILYTGGDGAFCEKIEQGVAQTPTDAWRLYQLP